MFKLYKKLRAKDWALLALLAGLTVLQVYCTITLVDFTRNIINSIMYLNYHNNPSSIPELGKMLAEMVSANGWDYTAEYFIANNGAGLPPEAVNIIRDVASASAGDIWYDGGMMLLVALGCMACQSAVGLIASYVASGLSLRLRTAVYTKDRKSVV